MKKTYRFGGVEIQYGRPPEERILHRGELIELTDQQYAEAVDGGAALELAGEPPALIVPPSVVFVCFSF